MNEIDTVIRLLESAEITERDRSAFSQIEAFEKFVSDMNIPIEKKQLLMNREDIIPQLYYLNKQVP